MVKTIFVSKRGMQRALTEKRTVYNSWTAFCKQMRLPFPQGRKFWKFLDAESRSLFLEDAECDTMRGTEKRDEMEKKVNAYELTGPLGSQDPLLPVCTKMLKQRLNADNSGLAEAWKKRNIQKWNSTLTNVIQGLRGFNGWVAWDVF